MNKQERFSGCLLGLACGDAVGTTVEFKPRGSFPPVTDMVGGGLFNLEPGQWTDDTSMALCLAESLISVSGFDAADQMARYLRWYRDGYLSSTGRCFDVGNATRDAILGFMSHPHEPYQGSVDPRSAGNGCLMRLAPVPMFYASDINKAGHFSAESARTTHQASECVLAAEFFGRVLARALNGETDKEKLLLSDADVEFTSSGMQHIAEGSYRFKSEAEIIGSGYVIQSLEAALWCFWTTDNFRDAVLRAVNLGDDADTTGAIVGQLAGAYYGKQGIPSGWLDRLFMAGKIERMALRLHALSLAHGFKS